MPSYRCRFQRPRSFHGPIKSMAPCLNDMLGVGDQQLGIEAVQFAQAVAGQAHAVRAVEAEQLRAGRLEADAAMRAGVMGREINVVGQAGCAAAAFAGWARPALRPRFARARPWAVPFRRSSMATIRLPSPIRRPNSTASANRARKPGPATSRSMTTSMLCRICRSRPRLSLSATIVPSTRARTKPCLQQVFEQVAVFALLAANERRQQREPSAFRKTC